MAFGPSSTLCCFCGAKIHDGYSHVCMGKSSIPTSVPLPSLDTQTADMLDADVIGVEFACRLRKVAMDYLHEPHQCSREAREVFTELVRKLDIIIGK